MTKALDGLVDLLDLEAIEVEFARGSIFTRDGRLATSVAQEGLIRPLTR